MQVTGATNSVAKSAIKSTSLIFALGLLATLMLAFAVVNWVAANWPYMDTDTRLILVQSVVILAVVLAAGSCWRNKNLVLFGLRFAALATGALLSLIGQIYQTGADSWLLFALWALLLLPWLLLSRDIFTIILWAVLVNCAVFLYSYSGIRWQLDTVFLQASMALVIVNFVLLLASMLLARCLSDPWHLLRRTFALATFAWLFVYQLNISDGHAGYWLANVLTLAYFAGIYVWFSKVTEDLFIVSFGVLAAVVILFLRLGINWITSLEDLFLLALGIFICGVLVVARLNALVNKSKQLSGHKPWYLLVFRLAILLIVVAILFVWLLLGVGFNFYENLMYLGLGLIVVGLVLVNLARFSANKDESDPGASVLTEFALVLAFLGLCVFVSYWLIENDNRGQLNSIAVLLVVSAIVYICSNSFLLRLSSSFVGLGSILIVLVLNNNAYYGDLDYGLFANIYYLSILLAAGAFIWFIKAQAWANYLRPLSWSMLLLAVTYAVSCDLFIDYSVWHWNYWYLAFMVATSLLPVFILWPYLRQHNYGNRIYIAILLLFAAAGTTGAFTLMASLCLLALGAVMARRLLLFIGALAFLAGLVLYYFQTGLSLPVKALQIGLTAFLLIATVLLARQSLGLLSKNNYYLRVSRAFVGGIVFGGLLVLGFSVYQVSSYKNILAHGEQLVLKLAPVDPRSLLQGDYMELAYELNNQTSSWLEQHPVTAKRVRAGQQAWYVLEPDANGVGQINTITTSLSQAHDLVQQDQNKLVLAFKWRNSAPDFGARAWFFPEGQGQQYAGAKYGVLKVDANGTALLADLLNQAPGAD